MKKVITITLRNNPKQTKAVLDGLRKCEGIGDYLILPHIDPGNEEVLSLAEAIGFAEVVLTKNPQFLGVTQNTYQAWQHGFSYADFIIHLEDDTQPTRDCLKFMEHCNLAYREDQRVFNISAFNGKSCSRSQNRYICRREPYNSCITGLWRNRWDWIKNHWHPPGDKYANYLNCYVRKFDLEEVYPLLSRAIKIHVQSGEPLPSPLWHDQQQRNSWSDHCSLPSGRYEEVAPLVTAVMLVGVKNETNTAVRNAIRCFQLQTHTNKELLIINVGNTSFFYNDHRICELRLKPSHLDSEGDLRNLGLAHARGEFIVNWAPGDWHHPHRIDYQLAGVRGNNALLLKNRICYNRKKKYAFYSRHPQGLSESIFHSKNIEFSYPQTAESYLDSFAIRFKKLVVLENDPALCVSFDAPGMSSNIQQTSDFLAALVNPDHKRVILRALSAYRVALKKH